MKDRQTRRPKKAGDDNEIRITVTFSKSKFTDHHKFYFDPQRIGIIQFIIFDVIYFLMCRSFVEFFYNTDLL